MRGPSWKALPARAGTAVGAGLPWRRDRHGPRFRRQSDRHHRGLPASGVSSVDSDTLSFVTPALLAGSINDVVVPESGRRVLTANASGVTIRGLAINRCPEAGIMVLGSGGGTIIAGNFLGTDPTGTSRPGAQYYGVEIEGATRVMVGGSNPADRNLCSGNDGAQLYLGDAGAPNAVVKGNLIGTDAAGTAALPGLSVYAQVWCHFTPDPARLR